MIENPENAQQVSAAIDYIKLGSLALGGYASILSSINFLSDRIRRLTLHIEIRDSELPNTTLVRVFVVCNSGSVLVPEVDIRGKSAEGSISLLRSISIGEVLRKNDLRVFDHPIEAFYTYENIWAEVVGYKLTTKSNAINATCPTNS